MNTLQMILIGVIAVVILVALYAIFVYNHVVTVKVRVDNAFSDILVQLKRRADLIPNLIETVKGYTKHESETLVLASSPLLPQLKLLAPKKK